MGTLQCPACAYAAADPSWDSGDVRVPGHSTPSSQPWCLWSTQPRACVASSSQAVEGTFLPGRISVLDWFYQCGFYQCLWGYTSLSPVVWLFGPQTSHRVRLVEGDWILRHCVCQWSNTDSSPHSGPPISDQCLLSTSAYNFLRFL